MLLALGMKGFDILVQNIIDNSTEILTTGGWSDGTTESPTIAKGLFGKLMEGGHFVLSEALTATAENNSSQLGNEETESRDTTHTTYDWRELFEEFKLTKLTKKDEEVARALEGIGEHQKQHIVA